jgi:hypothetical protein
MDDRLIRGHVAEPLGRAMARRNIGIHRVDIDGKEPSDLCEECGGRHEQVGNWNQECVLSKPQCAFNRPPVSQDTSRTGS